MRWVAPCRVWESVLVVAAACALVGCSSKPTRVYVDLDRIPMPPSSPPIAPIRLTERMESAAMTGSVASVQARSLFRGSSADRVRSALATVEANRRRGIRNHQEALQNRYLNEVDQRTSDQRDRLQQQVRERYDGAYHEIDELFRAYAESRGLPALRLALRVGSPDPDPDSRRVADPKNLRQQRDFRLAEELRKEIATLDAEYQAKASAILSSVDMAVRRDFAQLSEQQTTWRQEAMRRAREEAEALVEQVNRPFAGDLEQSLAERLAERPGVTVQVPAVRSLPLQSEISAEDPGPAVRRIARGHVQLWAKLNGYTLVDRPSLGRDGTSEFLAWRRSYRIGP